MKITRFEDLICWQKARELTNDVYRVTKLREFHNDRELVWQIRAACISTMSNIAEGFERWSRKELVRFLDIAKGSAREIRSQLYTALDQNYITQDEFEATVAMAIETSKTISGLIDYLQRSISYRVRESSEDEFELNPDLELPDEYCTTVSIELCQGQQS